MLPLTRLSKYIKKDYKGYPNELVKTSLIINYVYFGIHIITDITDNVKTYTCYMSVSDQFSKAYLYQRENAFLEFKGLLYQYSWWYRYIFIADYFVMRCPYINEEDWN